MLANLMIDWVDEKDDVDDAEQRQQYNCSFHRFPDDDNGQTGQQVSM